VKATVNGIEKQFDESISIVALLEIEDVESPDMVAVQVNGTILDRSEFATTHLKSGDAVEFLYFMGGGA
jgi:sulfur carrier protein